MRLNKDLFIGFDGGGTKTSCVIGDRSGHIYATAAGASTNVKSRASEQVGKVVHTLLAQLFHTTNASIGNVKVVYVSAAGGDRAEDKSRWKKWIYEYGIESSEIVVNNDAVGALAGGTFTTNGMVLIAGTGSIAYSMREDMPRPMRVGGWGYLFGDEGSGFAIGSNALKVIACKHDRGEGERDLLTDHILKKLELTSPEQLITCIYEDHYPRKIIASLAKHVIYLAEQGEAAATKIIQQALASLVGLVITILRSDEKSKQLPLVISGGLFQSMYFKRQFEKNLRREGVTQQIIAPDFPPVVGSYICALLHVGLVITDEMKSDITDSWREVDYHHYGGRANEKY